MCFSPTEAHSLSQSVTRGRQGAVTSQATDTPGSVYYYFYRYHAIYEDTSMSRSSTSSFLAADPRPQ